MASISYPTSLEIAGPWFFEVRNLNELDNVVVSCLEKMRSQREVSIERALAQTVTRLVANGDSDEDVRSRREQLRDSIKNGYPFGIDECKVIVYLNGGRSVEGKSFKELTALGQLYDEVPRGFSVKAQVAKTRIALDFPSWRDRGLTATAEADDDELAQELFGSLRNWLSDIQPKRWQQLWFKSKEASFGLAPLLFLACVLMMIYSLQPVSGPSQTQQRARELARQGVTPANQAQALQLILSIEAGYEPVSPPAVHRHVTLTAWALVFIAIFIVIALGNPPQGAVGVWGGRRDLERQRRWISIVSVSVPSLIVASVFVPLLTRIFGLSN